MADAIAVAGLLAVAFAAAAIFLAQQIAGEDGTPLSVLFAAAVLCTVIIYGAIFVFGGSP